VWVHVQTFEKNGSVGENSLTEFQVPNLKQLQTLMILENREKRCDHFMLLKQRGRCLEEWSDDGKVLLRTYIKALNS
jgi:hypothetical protein